MVETNHRFVSTIFAALLIISILYIAVFAGILGPAVANFASLLVILMFLVISVMRVAGKYPERIMANEIS